MIKKISFLLIPVFLIFLPVQASELVKVVINEFLPNPVGSDEKEWIELKNLSDIEVPLRGWKICDKSEKCFHFEDEKILPRGYLSLKREKTKLSINNSDEELILFGPNGGIASRIKFIGESKEGYSFSRFPGSDWKWTIITTLGKQNYFQPPEEKKDDYSNNHQSLINPITKESRGIFSLAIILGLVISGLGVFLMKKIIKKD